MIELKAYIAPTPDGTGLADYYLKSEADKVIAELKDKLRHYPMMVALLESDKKEIAELKKEKEYVTEHTTEVIEAQEQAIRHHKYKRCLAMADMCSEALCYWDNVKYSFFKGEAYCFRKMNHYGKWGQIWLAISEKFKEAK